MTDKLAASASADGWTLFSKSDSGKRTPEIAPEENEESPYLSDSTYILSAIPCYCIKLIQCPIQSTHLGFLCMINIIHFNVHTLNVVARSYLPTDEKNVKQSQDQLAMYFTCSWLVKKYGPLIIHLTPAQFGLDLSSIKRRVDLVLQHCLVY